MVGQRTAEEGAGTAREQETADTIRRADVVDGGTEYGTRRMRHRSTIARANALAEIAAPQYRDHLRDDWARLSQ